jgi:hypothetical protein
VVVSQSPGWVTLDAKDPLWAPHPSINLNMLDSPQDRHSLRVSSPYTYTDRYMCVQMYVYIYIKIQSAYVSQPYDPDVHPVSSVCVCVCAWQRCLRDVRELMSQPVAQDLGYHEVGTTHT